MSDLIDWMDNAPVTNIENLGALLASLPPIEKRSQKQQQFATSFADLLRQAKRINIAADIADIDYRAEKRNFLANAGKTGSLHTHKGYKAGLERLEAWASREGVEILTLTPAQADDFINSLKGRSSAAVRLDTSACSSFFSWLSRRHKGIDNPFRGTKERPAVKKVRPFACPEPDEMPVIMQAMPPRIAAAISVMAYCGLRAGALPSLSVTGGRFTAYSKGKAISGEMATEAIDVIKKAGLPLRSPFSWMMEKVDPGVSSREKQEAEKRAVNALEVQIVYYTRKLYPKPTKKCPAPKQLIKAPYSAHDFRHYYAVQEYRKDHDIYRLKGLLHHANISVTENYLRSLGEL